VDSERSELSSLYRKSHFLDRIDRIFRTCLPAGRYKENKRIMLILLILSILSEKSRRRRLSSIRLCKKEGREHEKEKIENSFGG
jgi:hypothetical protein